VNVKCETLRLKSKQGKSRKDRQAPAHGPSVLHPFKGVNAMTDAMLYAYRPLTTGITKTRENDQRLASFGRPVAT
jgi:hypothetical protein